MGVTVKDGWTVKQVRIGVAITEDHGIPLLGKAYSGNTSDQEMHPQFLVQLRETLSVSDFLFIADSKFDSKENLADIFMNNGFFLTPGAFSADLKKKYITKYREKYEYEKLSYLPETEKKKAKSKRKYYEAFELNKKMTAKRPDGKECKYSLPSYFCI